MEIIIAIGVFILFALFIGRSKREAEKDLLPARIKQVARINTILQNIEIYDGTPKGQKQSGGDL